MSFAWPNMKRDVKKYGRCDVCTLAKANRGTSHGQFRATERTGPHEEFGVDFYGMPQSKMGHKTILTVVDLFSGYTQYVPCREESAKEFVRAFAKSVIFRTGAPTSIRSDHAPQFLADVSKLLYEKLGIKHTTTRGCHPEGNSTAEIAHAFLGNCLRAAMSDEV